QQGTLADARVTAEHERSTRPTRDVRRKSVEQLTLTLASKQGGWAQTLLERQRHRPTPVDVKALWQADQGSRRTVGQRPRRRTEVDEPSALDGVLATVDLERCAGHAR